LSVSPAASWGTRLVEPPRRSGSIRAVVTPLVLAALAGLFGPAGIAMAGPEGPIASTSHHSTLSPTVSDSLKLRLKLPEKVKAGVAVPMTLRAENLRQEPLDLYLTGRPIAFDIIVLDEEGRVAWRRLEGEIIWRARSFQWFSAWKPWPRGTSCNSRTPGISEAMQAIPCRRARTRSGANCRRKADLW